MALKDSNGAERPRQCFLELLRRLPAQAIYHTMGDDTSTRPHELGEESSRKFLETYGILPEESDQRLNMPKCCPNCSEPNIPGARFCINQKCGICRQPTMHMLKQKKRNRKRTASL